MELSDAGTIHTLLAAEHAARSRRASPRLPVLRDTKTRVYCAPAAKSPGKRRCQCGHCSSCLENERWEQIFRTKFADPDYYGDLRIRNESPLNSW